MKNREKENSARIVAGFCWEWSEPNPDGSLVKDVQIGDFKMPWEKKDEFWKWATYSSGMDQVGTVYTAQGFEFDYIGVILAMTLFGVMSKVGLVSLRIPSISKLHQKSKLTEHFKHVYRVLMSRAHKGVYLYFMDKETEKFVRSKIEVEDSGLTLSDVIKPDTKQPYEVVPSVPLNLQFKEYLPVLSLKQLLLHLEKKQRLQKNQLADAGGDTRT
jgi:DUF2075 family protein